MVAAFCGFPARPSLRPHAGPAPRRRYERRRPEKTPLHKIISENLASWLEWRDEAERPVPGYVEEELRGDLECGILCFSLRPCALHGLRPGVCDRVLVQGARGFFRPRLSRARQPWEPLAFPSAARQDGAMDGPPCPWLAPPVPVRQWVI